MDKTSLTFTADNWATAQTVTVRAAGDADAVVDAAVTISHTVSSPGDYAGETASNVEVRIAESDTPTLSIADESVAEDAVSATFTVTLSVASSNEVTVDYVTSNGTGPEAATAGEDYTEADGTLKFPANSAAAQTIRVPITDDDLDEADEETFTLTLHSAAHADLAGGGTTLAAAGTITDDDDPPAAGIADAGASEGDGGITFTVSLETASARVVTGGLGHGRGTPPQSTRRPRMRTTPRRTARCRSPRRARSGRSACCWWTTTRSKSRRPSRWS